MADHDDLERWWNGLTEQERADAIRSSSEGRLSEAMQESLAQAGLLTHEHQKDRSIPKDVRDFLDEQDADEDLDEPGDDGADDPLTGGKMRH